MLFRSPEFVREAAEHFGSQSIIVAIDAKQVSAVGEPPRWEIFTHGGKNLNVGDEIISGVDADIKVGNTLPMQNIPVGTFIHNIELQAGRGGQLVRSAGTAAQLNAKEGKYVTVRLPSGETRYIRSECRATIGRVSNETHEIVVIGKAGRNRHLGIRPTVRGSAMNPVDHPHGGGEGRTSIGMPSPLSPWGKPTLGYKTRKPKKYSNELIIKGRRKKKKKK